MEALLVRSHSGADNRGRRDQIRALVTLQNEPILAVLRATPGLAPADLNSFMSGVASSHIWCRLLAAESANLTLEALDARGAATVFFDTPEGRSFDNIDAIINAVVTAGNEQRPSVVEQFDSQDELKRCLQIAAMFICPAPEAHPLLLNSAALPILDELFADDVLVSEVRPSLTAG